MGRIFIENLPETATEAEIQSDFSNFGVVTSVQIKERKNVTFRHSSPYFAYIDLDTTHNNLQKCFQHFNENEWHGQRVKLQIAKESFLERLKRERESNPQYEGGANNQSHEEVVLNNIVDVKKKVNGIDTAKKVLPINIPSLKINQTTKSLPEEPNGIEPDYHEPNIVKNNTNRLPFKKLKIESVGNKPLPTSEPKARSLDKLQIEADKKRIESLSKRKKMYKEQKTAIKAALSYSNINKSNKIIFDNEQMETSNKNAKRIESTATKPLFDEDVSDEEDNTFDFKEKFQGQAGAELLKLQSNFKNDKRFVLDAKFLENDEAKDEIPGNDIEIEKKKEYEILESILEHEVKTVQRSRHENDKKGMKRFDPSLPDHHQYEMKKEVKKSGVKRKKETPVNDKKVEDKEIPEVSKEVFYVIEDNLKTSLEEDKGFSLLNLFGNAEEKEQPESSEPSALPIKGKNYFPSENPFKYDSSDDEDQTEQLPQKEITAFKTVNSLKVWSEPFFFQEDDFRLQEGVDFVQKIATEEKEDFIEVRRNLKEIARNKVRNNLRKNRPFKKKLGGNRMKKMKRMNKALKRVVKISEENLNDTLESPPLACPTNSSRAQKSSY